MQITRPPFLSISESFSSTRTIQILFLYEYTESLSRTDTPLQLRCQSLIGIKASGRHEMISPARGEKIIFKHVIHHVGGMK